MRGKRSALTAVTLAIFAAMMGANAAQAINSWDFYRWPWRYGQAWTMTEGWNGATSHRSSNGLFYAVDVDLSTTHQPVFAAEEGSATCQWDSSNGFGYYVRITHSSDSSLYAHLQQCDSSLAPRQWFKDTRLARQATPVATT
jgi:murein DD-endopeptidase MepM/ murein hydrolase activator NlpD